MITKLLNKKDELVAAFRSSAVVDTMVNKSRAFMVLLASVFACPAAMAVFAADESSVANSIFGTILGIIGTIFLYIGLVLLVWAVAQLVLAFKNEDADSKSRAITLIVVSIVLIAMPNLIQGIVNATGVGVTVNKDIGGLM